MIKKILYFTFSVNFLLLWQSCFGQNQNNIKHDVYLQKIIQADIQQEHFHPLNIDDTFSVKAFESYMKMLDYSKRFMIQADIDALKKFQYHIDNEYLETKMEFFDLSLDIITHRTRNAEKYCFDALNKPFDFSVEEKYTYNPDSISWAVDTLEIKDRWRKLLKYEILSRIYSTSEDQKKAKEKSDTVSLKSFEELEKQARSAVEKRYKDWFDYTMKSEDSDYFALYINAILSVYDPHTEFYPPKNKEDFDIMFSGQLEGIGATLTQKDGYVTISDVKIGSPAWKQGELETNDKILKVTQGNTKETVDIVDMRLDKAIRYIRGPKGTEVILTIQKVDGSQKTISLIRDIIIIEETYAKSMILTDKTSRERIGYIYLPSFYANFQDKFGRRSSVDMAKEVEKLKTENVKGIIIDLRNNTGGSLMDCVDIAGLFIDKGPIVQVQSKNGAPHVLADVNSGTKWDGPLVILVNSYSASASEIFAAAMQDYGRAIIMGTTTYGKGSVQRFDDLDRMIHQNDIKPLGSIKLTIQKYFRINGNSTQLKGVSPNIWLPDNYSYMKTGERELDNALPWTEITSSNFSLWNNGACKWDNIIKKSEDRIQKNNFFALTDENAKRLKQRRDEYEYPLQYDAYEKFIKTQNTEAEKYKDLGKDTLNIEAFILPNNNNVVDENDTAAVERNKKWYQMIVTDNSIYEAMQVIQDMERMRCFATKRND